MIGDRDLQIRRDTNSTAWLTNSIWEAARRQQLDHIFVDETTAIEDDHRPFLQAGVPAVDIIDLDYEPWHTAKDTLDAVSARSLQVVGDALLAALPQIETKLTKGMTLTGRRPHRDQYGYRSANGEHKHHHRRRLLQGAAAAH
jgi:hypothetical protein